MPVNQFSPDTDRLAVTRRTPTCRAVALLVDGENISIANALRLIFETQRLLGPVTVARVYGDVCKLNGWAESPGFRMIHAYAGKNVTDMLLTVEAMELSFVGHIDGFAIATRDRDFAPLAWSLKARGFPTVGLAPDVVSDALAQAFTHHVVLNKPVPGAVASVAPARDAPEQPRAMVADPAPDDEPLKMPLDLLLALGAVLGSGEMSLSDFGKKMGDRAIAKPINMNWKTYLEPLVGQFLSIGEGPSARIRILT